MKSKLTIWRLDRQWFLILLHGARQGKGHITYSSVRRSVAHFAEDKTLYWITHYRLSRVSVLLITSPAIKIDVSRAHDLVWMHFIKTEMEHLTEK